MVGKEGREGGMEGGKSERGVRMAKFERVRNERRGRE